MMAGPTTEVLNEDVKELRAEVHQLEVTMTREFGLVRAEMAREFGEVRGEMEKGFGEVRGEIKELRAEVRSALRVATWGMGIFATVVIGLVVFAVSASWWASKLDSRLGRLERPAAVSDEPR